MAKILIIEDTPINMLLTETLLENARHIPLCADLGLLGFEIAQREIPDLILLDIGLPDLNGVTLLGMLKKNIITSAIPVIALTAHAMIGDRQRLLASGFDGYIEKPIIFEDFLFEIDRLLAKVNTAS